MSSKRGRDAEEPSTSTGRLSVKRRRDPRPSEANINRLKESFKLFEQSFRDSSLSHQWKDGKDYFLEKLHADMDKGDMKESLKNLRQFEVHILGVEKTKDWKNWKYSYWNVMTKSVLYDQCIATVFVICLKFLEEGLEPNAFKTSWTEVRSKWVEDCDALIDPDHQLQLYEELFLRVNTLLQAFGFNSMDEYNAEVNEVIGIIREFADQLEQNADSNIKISLIELMAPLLLRITKTLLPFADSICNMIDTFRQQFDMKKHTIEKPETLQGKLTNIENVTNSLITSLTSLITLAASTDTERGPSQMDIVSQTDNFNRILSEGDINENVDTYILKPLHMTRSFTSYVQGLRKLFVDHISNDLYEEFGIVNEIVSQVIGIVETGNEIWREKKTKDKAEKLRRLVNTIETTNETLNSAIQLQKEYYHTSRQ